MTRRARAAALLVVAALAVGAPACGDDDDTGTDDTNEGTVKSGDQPGSGGEGSVPETEDQDKGGTPGGSNSPDAGDETDDAP
jgi:hypothetical protein